MTDSPDFGRFLVAFCQALAMEARSASAALLNADVTERKEGKRAVALCERLAGPAGVRTPGEGYYAQRPVTASMPEQFQPLERSPLLTLDRCRRHRRQCAVHVRLVVCTARNVLALEPFKRLGQHPLVLNGADDEV